MSFKKMITEKVIFKDYTISIDGTITSLKNYGGKTRVLKQNLDKNTGYMYVTLMIDKKPVTKRTHRLVAEAFIDRPSESHIVNHKDGDKTNNHIDNLEWVTYSENTKHSYKNGLQKTGEGHSQTKYSDKIIEQIHRLNRKGFTQVKIAEILRMRQPYISAILTGRIRNYG